MHNPRAQKLCAWSGLIGILCFGLAFWPFSMFFPPPAPSLSPAEVAALYQQNTTGIRIAMILIMFAGAFDALFVAAISVQIRRMETTPIWTYAQLAVGTVGAMIFFLAPLAFSAAAFNPYRAPELTAILHEVGWLSLIMPVQAGFLQNLVIGAAILQDKRAQPVFPRWFGYFNFWVALLFAPATLVTFFKTGPFAWNGIIAFYLAAGIFGAWFIVMLVMLLKAINQQGRSPAAAA